MRIFSIGYAATIGIAALYSASVLAADVKENAKPTGACTITVYGIAPTCTAAMTKDACETTAKKVGGKESWVQGGSCPNK
jgi:hypothetical protein